MANTIDPRLFLPPNVVNLGYKDEVSESSDEPVQFIPEADNVELVLTPDEYSLDPIEDMEGAFDEERLLPPDSITLVSQAVRVTSGGTVVDIVIDVEDVANASQFEVRVTK